METKLLRTRFPELREAGVAAMGPLRLTAADAAVRHRHDVVEVCFMVAGAGRHQVGEHAVDLRPGMAAIIHQTQAHLLLSRGSEIINFFLDPAHFPPCDLGELQPRLHGILPLNPGLRHLSQAAPHLMLGLGGMAHDALRGLLAEQGARRPGRIQAMQAHARVFLIELARAAPAIPSASRPGPVHHAEAARLWLLGHLDEPLRIRDLARHSGCSPATLTRQFRTYTGHAPLAFIQRLRLERASALLATTGDPIAEVAAQCGFPDPAFFYRVFRRRFGAAPGAWRQRARSEDGQGRVPGQANSL